MNHSFLSDCGNLLMFTQTQEEIDLDRELLKQEDMVLDDQLQYSQTDINEPSQNCK